MKGKINLIQVSLFSLFFFKYFRWSYVKTELSKQGIIVHGNSSDADPRLLKAMKIFTNLGYVVEDDQFEKWKGLFFAKITNDMFCLQDLFHIISKIRTRLLETSCPMRIGNHKISLTTLRVNFSTALTISDMINIFFFLVPN